MWSLQTVVFCWIIATPLFYVVPVCCKQPFGSAVSFPTKQLWLSQPCQLGSQNGGPFDPKLEDNKDAAIERLNTMIVVGVSREMRTLWTFSVPFSEPLYLEQAKYVPTTFQYLSHICMSLLSDRRCLNICHLLWLPLLLQLVVSKYVLICLNCIYYTFRTLQMSLRLTKSIQIWDGSCRRTSPSQGSQGSQ